MTAEQPPSGQEHPAPADTTPSRLPDDHATAAPAVQQPPAAPPRTRTSTAFTGFVAGAIVLILLLVFILENTQSVKISYFGASGHLALGIALLLAAVGGGLLIGILGTARIAQIRRHAKRGVRRQP